MFRNHSIEVRAPVRSARETCKGCGKKWTVAWNTRAGFPAPPHPDRNEKTDRTPRCPSCSEPLATRTVWALGGIGVGTRWGVFKNVHWQRFDQWAAKLQF